MTIKMMVHQIIVDTEFLSGTDYSPERLKEIYDKADSKVLDGCQATALVI